MHANSLWSDPQLPAPQQDPLQGVRGTSHRYEPHAFLCRLVRGSFLLCNRCGCCPRWRAKFHTLRTIIPQGALTLPPASYLSAGAADPHLQGMASHRAAPNLGAAQRDSSHVPNHHQVAR